jgi:hypothetical protein
MFHRVCIMYNISIVDIWNVDETAFMIGIGKDPWVLTRDEKGLLTLAAHQTGSLSRLLKLSVVVAW